MTFDAFLDIINIMSYIAPGILARDARRRAQLSQRALATKAGTTQAAIARIEAGQTSPSFDTLRRLVGASGFDLRVELVAHVPPDPVIDAYKRDVDQSLLLENLRKTPEQRVQTLVAMASLAADVRPARRVAERKK